MDRNYTDTALIVLTRVALRKESVDRNIDECWKLIGTDSVALLPKPAARNSCYLSKTSRIK